MLMLSNKLALATVAAATALVLAPAPSMAGREIQRVVVPQQVETVPTKRSSFLDQVLFYIPNRALDLIDIGRLSVGVGPGFDANVRVTELATVGMGQYETTRFGMKGRTLPVYEENIDEGGVGFLGYVNGKLQRDPSEIGGDLHVGVVGLQVAASLAEAADFLAGLILIDLQKDDLTASPWE
jgi:hypothetical protein